MITVVFYPLWICTLEDFDVNIESKIIDRLKTISLSVFAAIPFQQQDKKQKILAGTTIEERLSLGLKIL